MEVSEKARFQKKAAFVATKRSNEGTSEWQFGEMRDSLIAWKILWKIKIDAEGVDAFRR